MRKRETKFLIATCLLGFAAVSLSSSGCGNNGGAAKNPDGSLVAVLYSAAAKTNYVVAMGGKKLQFSVPAAGWATVRYKP